MEVLKINTDPIIEKVERLKKLGHEIYIIEEKSIWFFDKDSGQLRNIYLNPPK